MKKVLKKGFHCEIESRELYDSHVMTINCVMDCIDDVKLLNHLLIKYNETNKIIVDPVLFKTVVKPDIMNYLLGFESSDEVRMFSNIVCYEIPDDVEYEIIKL